ncbi:MAG: hypothetical protein GF307_03930 [candidate division Zixibacteria bacterium]|nr:hypothetical protein [candidate division Zixibacteria bacterium]
MNHYYHFCSNRLVKFFTFLLLLTFSLSSAQEWDRKDASSTCLDCHDGYITGLKGSSHQILNVSESSALSCVDCHDGWQEHLNEPSKENITAGPEANMETQGKICSSCHVNSHQSAMLTNDAHNTHSLNCSSCHKIHNNRDNKLLLSKNHEFCTDCHQLVRAQFQLRSVHPLHSRSVKCTDCHGLSGIENDMGVRGLNWKCQDCHDEKSGPFIYEHPVVYNHLVEGGSCMECHKPHGSANDRLLKQNGNSVCLQCHAIPSGHRTNHSALGTKLACVDCHSEIHGSYDNKYFLDPDLGTRLFPNCYQSGCHIVN